MCVCVCVCVCICVLRVHFREQHDGVHVLLQLLDTILFPSTSSSSSAEERPVPDQSDSACCSSVHKLLPREGVVILPHPLDSQAINIIQEILKILFNQTVDKKDDDLEEVWPAFVRDRFHVTILCFPTE